MNMLNHSIAANRQPMFPANASGAHDACQHPPSAPPLSLKPFQQNPSKKTSPILASTALNVELEPLAFRFVSDAMVELGRDFAAGPNVAVLNVTVASAVELDDTQNELIARKMQRLTGFGNLRIENVVDASLIAGFVISYGAGGSHVIDLSVKGQLAMLAAKIESSDERRIGNSGQSWSFSK